MNGAETKMRYEKQPTWKSSQSVANLKCEDLNGKNKMLMLP